MAMYQVGNFCCLWNDLLYSRLYHAQVGLAKSEVWAITLSTEGQYLAGTTHDGRIKVWDLYSGAEMIRDYETKGSYGLCIDIVSVVIQCESTLH